MKKIIIIDGGPRKIFNTAANYHYRRRPAQELQHGLDVAEIR